MTSAGSAAGPLLFVYGTLREEARGPLQHALSRGWTFVEHGTVAGRLYDLGAYPGAVPSEDPGERVRGELHRLPDDAETLARLDHHEGCGPGHPPPHEFTRERVDVVLASGGTAEAWIYWYRRETRPESRLVRGDYLERRSPAESSGLDATARAR